MGCRASRGPSRLHVEREWARGKGWCRAQGGGWVVRPLWSWVVRPLWSLGRGLDVCVRVCGARPARDANGRATGGPLTEGRTARHDAALFAFGVPEGRAARHRGLGRAAAAADDVDVARLARVLELGRRRERLDEARRHRRQQAARRRHHREGGGGDAVGLLAGELLGGADGLVVHVEHVLLVHHAWMVRRGGKNGDLGGLWLDGSGLLVGSETLGLSSRVRRAASSLQMQPDEPVVASCCATKAAL